MTAPLPAVGHLLRRYRTRTETFVGAQVSGLERYRPVILCEDYARPRYEPSVTAHAAHELLRGVDRRLERLVYRFARALTHTGAAALARAARAEDTRVLHAHYLVDARFFQPTVRRLGIPLVVSAYGYDVSSFPRRLGGVGGRYLQPLWQAADLVLAMSHDMRRDLEALGCPSDRIRVHYHGIRVERFACPERPYRRARALNILCTGTLEVKKAQHLVLEALRRVAASGADVPQFTVTLVGGGPMQARLQAQVRESRLHSRVTFMGHIDHQDSRLVDAYRAADIFALPSITVGGDKEGIPGTLAEAMAAGLPVVSSRHAGIPELVQDGQSGMLVDEGDIEGLSAAFARLMRDADLRAALGTAAIARVHAFGDVRQRTRDLECIYDGVLGHVRH